MKQKTIEKITRLVVDTMVSLTEKTEMEEDLQEVMELAEQFKQHLRKEIAKQEEAKMREYLVTVYLEGLETFRISAKNPSEAKEIAKEYGICVEDIDFSESYEVEEIKKSCD